MPQSVVYHVGGATLKKGSPRKTYLNFRNNLLMLYKNLPESELRSVMRARFWLDYVAALSFLLKGQVADARAVVRAHRDFAASKAEFAPARADNLRRTVLSSIPERSTFCILVRYYLKGCRAYSQLV